MSEDLDKFFLVITEGAKQWRNFELKMQAIASNLNDFIEKNRKEIDEWAKSFQTIMRKATEDYYLLLEGLKQYDVDVKDYLELTARLGWPPFLEIDIQDIRTILDGLFEQHGGREFVDVKSYIPSESDIKYFSKMMIELFNERPKIIEDMKCFWMSHPLIISDEYLKVMIDDIVFSFESGKYYSTVATMLPIFEIILIKIRDSNKEQYAASRKRDKKTGIVKIDTAKISETKIIFEKIFNQDSIITHLNIIEFLEYFFFASESSRKESVIIKKKYYEIDFNRHMIVHGEYVNYGRRDIAIKGLILLNNILSCTVAFMSDDGVVHLSSCDGLDLLSGRFIRQEILFSNENANKCPRCIVDTASNSDFVEEIEEDISES